ncbi:acyl-CoA dehydrogenase family protein [Paraburkholderia sp. MMS20-SJTR3]|uniref:Acyl-CoA dehydrogenase family protein n=1 Tax=Paraburkholderia sejongensis TaxID=2886946 RepID=A0ABS8JRM5_9BURK|nr:acyl-CoA dehydrogenase family protein [Paraburkholderia sp. MMS20-SJTR3]MCC8392487.1 acyl-CoA dehydrogenase family protein [Paraburkholderia sp. MMS20-SJTR3]
MADLVSTPATYDAPHPPAPAPHPNGNARARAEPQQIAAELATRFALSAVERDQRGGTPKAERDALRASGLLALSIPTAYGGLGASWRTTLDVVRIIAGVDGSLAHVFAFHHLMLATVRLFGTERQWGSWFEKTARHDWFWGNALNPLDDRTLSHSRDDWLEFSGQKSFCSGALDSEMLIASARDARTNAFLVAAVPTQRSGIAIADDWDNIGQRQTDSGTVTFERVRVDHHEVLVDPGPLSTPFACLRPLIAQLILAHVYLGIGEAAFEDARRYTLNEARPWPASQLASVGDDPYILAQYGEFWVGLEAVRTLAARAADRLDDAWARGLALSESERGEVALAVATAKVAAAQTGLDICTRMFDVAGARATHGSLRLDRYWRNLRTHTLHDPLAYKMREIGEWALKRTYPTPSFYS